MRANKLRELLSNRELTVDFVMDLFTEEFSRLNGNTITALGHDLNRTQNKLHDVKQRLGKVINEKRILEKKLRASEVRLDEFKVFELQGLKMDIHAAINSGTPIPAEKVKERIQQRRNK